jgi:DNA invertase Pin-like site-specific DNA recombinase
VPTGNGLNFSACLTRFGLADTIVVWKLDRLARSIRDLLNTMETINEAGGKFQSLSESWANTTTHAGKMIMTVFAGIAEFERDLIRERTSAGRDAARQRGSAFRSATKAQSGPNSVCVSATCRRQGCSRHCENIQCARGHHLSFGRFFRFHRVTEVY